MSIFIKNIARSNEIFNLEEECSKDGQTMARFWFKISNVTCSKLRWLEMTSLGILKYSILDQYFLGCYCLVFPKGFRATIRERSFKPIAVSLDVLLILQAFAARIDPKSDAFKVNECKSLW